MMSGYKGLGDNQIKILNYFRLDNGKWRDIPHLLKKLAKHFEFNKTPAVSMYVALNRLVKRNILETQKPPTFGIEKRYWRLKDV